MKTIILTTKPHGMTDNSNNELYEFFVDDTLHSNFLTEEELAEEIRKISKEYDLIFHLEETVFTDNGIDYFYNFHINEKEIFHMVPYSFLESFVKLIKNK